MMDNMENYVLDTNSLIMSLSSRNEYSYIWSSFVKGNFCLCVTNEILEEYEEVISRNINPRIAKLTISYMLMLPNVKFFDPHYSFGLIQADYDDNKFVDCAIVANARCIVSEDHHFDVLASVDFPKVDVIGIDDFLSILKLQGNITNNLGKTQ